jgi:hypothetical protein
LGAAMEAGWEGRYAGWLLPPHRGRSSTRLETSDDPSRHVVIEVWSAEDDRLFETGLAQP